MMAEVEDFDDNSLEDGTSVSDIDKLFKVQEYCGEKKPYLQKCYKLNVAASCDSNCVKKIFIEKYQKDTRDS